MKLQDVIDKRCSVRFFEKKRVSRNIIKKLITNAIKAPSACNRQPWIFYSIDNKKKRDEVSNLLNRIYLKHYSNSNIDSKNIKKVSDNFYSDIGGAQNIIFIFRKKHKTEAEHVKLNDIASISCAVENIMLSAVDFGLGTCWVGTFCGNENKKELRKILGNKNDEELISAVVIGYPNKNFKRLKRDKKKVSEVLKFI